MFDSLQREDVANRAAPSVQLLRMKTFVPDVKFSCKAGVFEAACQ